MNRIFCIALCLARLACGRRIGDGQATFSQVSADGTLEPYSTRSLASLLLAVNPAATQFRTAPASKTIMGIVLPSAEDVAASEAAEGTSASKLEAEEHDDSPAFDQYGQPLDSQPLDSQETYNMMLKAMLNVSANGSRTLKNEINSNWNLVDARFLRLLGEEIDKKDPETIDRLTQINSVISDVMATRMKEAAETLKEIIQSPTPVIMEGKVTGLARQGRIDEALLDLVRGNLQQAQQAVDQGIEQAKNAVIAMQRILEIVQVETDKKLPPATALIRKLLRLDSADEREALLREAMSKKDTGSTLDLTGVEMSPASSKKGGVTPTEIAQAITEIKRRFGNVNEEYDSGFVKKLEVVAEEAENVALDMAGGKEMSAKQQQDYAWEQGSVSVWDLEAVEEEAHQDGKMAYWEEDAQKQFRESNEKRESAAKRSFDQRGN